MPVTVPLYLLTELERAHLRDALLSTTEDPLFSDELIDQALEILATLPRKDVPMEEFDEAIDG